MRQTGCRWYWPITGRWLQAACQSTGIVTMIIYQIGNGFATMLFWQVILISAILFNMIMFDMWLGAAEEKRTSINLHSMGRHLVKLAGIRNVTNLHFGMKWQGVKTFCRRFSHNETTFFITLLEKRFGSLTWHITDIPSATTKKNKILISKRFEWRKTHKEQAFVSDWNATLTRIYLSRAFLLVSHNCWVCIQCCRVDL